MSAYDYWIRNMKLRELKQKLRQLGFYYLKRRGRGSHTVWRSPTHKERFILSGKNNKNAKLYQEKMLKKAMVNK